MAECKDWVWWNGEMVRPEDPRLPTFHHGIGVGDGVYETFRTYAEIEPAKQLRAETLSPVVDRFGIGLDHFRLQLETPIEALGEIAEELLYANVLNDRDARLRIVAVRQGVAPAPPKREGYAVLDGNEGRDPASLGVYALPIDQPALDERRQRGLSVLAQVVPSRVTADPLFQLKHLGNMSALRARLVCRHLHFDDAFFFNEGGYLCEAIHANVWVIPRDRSVIVTPPVTSPCLPGHTRRRLLRALPLQGLPVREEPIDMKQLVHAAEIFLSSSIAEVMPVVKIDSTLLGDGTPGPIAQRAQEALRLLIADGG